ncbi:hypothetical protein MCETHM1_02537 [Flavobacteriaceae bacterium]
MIIFVKTIVMEALDKKPVFKSADEIIRLMLESKKQSKIETQERYNTPEFQEILRKLREMKKVKK